MSQVCRQVVRVIVAFLTLFSTEWMLISTANAQCHGLQTHKLYAADGGTYGAFGISVGLSETTLIVGSTFPVDPRQQAAYLFNAATGEQLFKLTTVNDGERFGEAVATDGTLALVGAPYADRQASNSGSAYLFRVSTGALLAILNASDPTLDKYFGTSVAIHGNIAIVGAPGDGTLGAGAGVAYIFDVSDPRQPRQLLKLLAGDGVTSDTFGFIVQISADNVVLITAPSANNTGRSGRAYLFDARTGQQLFRLLPHDAAPENHFGRAGAIGGPSGKGLAVIGAWGDDEKGQDAGAAYLFDVNSGMELAKLTASDGEAGDRLGSTVTLNETVSVIGVPHDDANGSNSGSAYLFDVRTAEQLGKVYPHDGYIADKFPGALAMCDATLCASLPSDDDLGAYAGAVYLFDVHGGPLLSVHGPCPGRIHIKLVGATENARAALLYSSGTGHLRIPQGNPCAGTVLGLDASTRLAAVLQVAGDGSASFNASVPPPACGSVYVQAIDLFDCAPSNVALVE